MATASGGSRIRAKNVIVELDGDEMTRVIWAWIKERLIEPFVDVKLERYDLHLPERDRTDDEVTMQAAQAIRRHGVGVKCATITPDAARVKEYNLKKAWPSPNGTIRAVLDGTVFRRPIIVKNVPPTVRTWIKPITIARHAYGDIYKNAELRIPGPGRVELVYTPAGGGEPSRVTVQEMKGAGVAMGMQNLESSIRSFAKSCVTYAVSERLSLWFGAKDTISKVYHALFKDTFRAEVESRRAEMEAAGVTYQYMLIDDAVARAIRHEGGFLWACMNYDGDVLSDMVASGFGSLGLMTSALVSPEGLFKFEAAHGTVQKHYYQHQRGEKTSTNATASIFAWTGALAKRGELDGTPDLVEFAKRLEASVIETIESGVMTRDLANLAEPKVSRAATTDEFMEAIASRLRAKIESAAVAR